MVAEWVSPLLFGMKWLAGAIPALIALGFIVLSQIAKKECVRDQGWRIDNFIKSLKMLVPMMLFASLVLFIVGWYLGSLKKSDVSFGLPLFSTSLGLFIWGLTQQYPLQTFINRRAQAIWGTNIRSVTFVAAAFALLHLPNFWLVVATFLGGLMWAYVYQRVPNLWALALSHAIMTAVLVLTLPYPDLHGLRVGYNYYR